MGSCAAPSAKGDDKFITTDYLQQCLPGKSDVMVADICLKPEIQSETDYKKTKELVRTEFEENLPVGSKIKEKDLNAVIEAFATRKRDTPERADHCQENVRERYWEMNPVKDK